MTATRRAALKDIGLAGIGISFGALAAGCGRSSPSQALNLYTWDTYIGKNTVADFTRAAGAGVNISLFANNDELFAKLRSGNQGYDVIVPSNDFVERFRAAGLLEDLDHGRLPNLKNIAPPFLNPPFDPGRRVSVPYTWIVTGIGYRKSKVDGVPDSWKWVLDSDRYKGRIGLLAEASELFEIGAKYLGKPANADDPATLDAVEAMLRRQKPNIAVFHDDNGQDLLLGGDIDLVIEYNGDIAQVMREDADIGFVVPREGGILASDSLCIPRGAPHRDLAYAYLDFVLGARPGADIAETIRYPTPNAAALALMPQEYRTNPVIFPPASALARCEYSRYRGPEANARYEAAMTRVRAA